MENNKITQKDICLILISIVSILFLIISLSFNITTVSTKGVEVKESINGFKWISDYKDGLEFIGSFIHMFNITLIVIAILEVLLYVYNIFSYKETRLKYEKTVIVVNILLLAVFMVNGFLAVAKLTEVSIGENEELKNMIKITTTAFVPFIIELIIGIGYFVAKSKLSDDRQISLRNMFAEGNAKISEEDKQFNHEKHNIELIRDYKKLFDENIITEEQYNLKLNELLK